LIHFYKRATQTIKMASALGNLMANYTDSEGEEMAEGGSEGEGEGNPSLADRLSRLEAPTNATGTPHSSASATSNKSTPVKKAALVSYHDPDAGLSDEERSPVPMDLESDAEAEGEGEGNGEDAEAEQAMIEAETEKIRIMEELWQEGVKLPPEPPGHCSKELQAAQCPNSSYGRPGKRLKRRGRTRWRGGQIITESSRARRLSEIQAFMKSSSFTATLTS